MAAEEGLKSITKVAGADLSASQYRFVSVEAAGTVIRNTSSGGACLGINQGNTAAAGREVQVAVSGVSKVVLGAVASTAGVKCMSDTTGRAILATGTGAKVLGTLLTTGVENDIAEILLDKEGELN